MTEDVPQGTVKQRRHLARVLCALSTAALCPERKCVPEGYPLSCEGFHFSAKSPDISSSVLPVNHRQPFQQQIIIQHNLPPAVGHDLLRQPACGDYGHLSIKLF